MRDRYQEMCDIAECELCDDDGIRANQLGKCDHIDYGSIARRHIPIIKAQLKKGGK